MADESTGHPAGISWVVFDLGDVLLRRTSALPQFAQQFGVPAAEFERAYFARRADLDRSSDTEVFWTSVAEATGHAGFSVEQVPELAEADDAGWNVPDRDAVALLAELAANGIKIAILSNAPSSIGTMIKAADWSAPVTHVLISGDHGVIKPDAAIFHLLLRTLGAAPEEVVFLDDRADNVQGAQAVGLHALVFRSAGQARRDLRDLGLPLGPAQVTPASESPA